jgi:acyl carrier protein
MDELILTVEGEFEIKLHDNEIIRLCNIADLVAVIENALSLTDLDE